MHLTWYSIHNTVTDLRCARSHSNNPQLRNYNTTTRSSSLSCVSAAEHNTAEQDSKTGWTKPRKHLTRIRLSWNTCQEFLKIPSLSEAVGNRVKMLLKNYFGIKCHSQHNKVIRLLRPCSANGKCGWLGMH